MTEKTRMPQKDNESERFDSCFYYGSIPYPHLHCHDNFWEFTLTVKGDYVNNLNGEDHRQKVNSVFLMRPDDVHVMESKSYGGEYLNLCVSDELIHDFLNVWGGGLYDRLLSKDFVCFDIPEAMTSCIRKITNDYFCNPSNSYSLTCYSIFCTFAAQLINSPDNTNAQKYSASVNAFLSLFSDPENLARPLRSLISETHYSYSRMNTVFGEEVGISPSEYLKKRRVDYAKKMLLHSEAKCFEISQKIGLATPARFSIFFKQQTGYTPSQFVKKYKHTDNRK